MFKYDLGDGADLRFLEIRHAQEFLDFVTENRSYLGEWLGWPNRITTLEAAQGFIRRGITRYEEDGLPWVGIWLNDRLAGGILFFPIDDYIRATEIGYWLGEWATGQGLMTRSVRAMLDFVFADLQLNRVGLNAEVSNKRSRTLAERLGFTFEGIKRQGWINGEELVDMAMYSMLASDWHDLK